MLKVGVKVERNWKHIIHRFLKRKAKNIDIDAIAEQIATEILNKALENIERFNAIATGRLYASGKIEHVKRGEYLVYFDVPYARYVEFGTAPHTPPIIALWKWARAKYGVSSEEAWRIAYKVQQAIAEVGTKPRPFLRKAVDDVKFEILNSDELRRLILAYLEMT